MSSQATNPNYVETEDGWVKQDQSQVRGRGPFDKPIPPVRVGSLPLVRGGNGKVDWKKVEEEKRGQA